jgi:hypothetical protein
VARPPSIVPCPLRAAPTPACGVPALGVARVASTRPHVPPFTLTRSRVRNPTRAVIILGF